MKNIHEIFESRQEESLEYDYQQIQEFFITEEEMFENLLYVTYDSSKLQVIKEEADESIRSNKKGVISKLTEQMNRVIKWILKMVGLYREKFEKGARLVKKYDLNKCMNKIRNNGKDGTINYHPNKVAFQSISNKCVNNINRLISDTKIHSIKMRPGDYDDSSVDQNTEDEKYLTSLLNEFKLSENHMKEIKLTQLNTINIHNTLTALPDANKKLENIKTKVQNVYTSAINNIRSKGDTQKEQKANRANNELKMINSNMRKINEQIRGYAKIMNKIFDEEYGAAKALISAATGGKAEFDDGGEQQPKENKEEK